MRLDYVAKRIGFFLIIVWLAATLNFFIPRLSGQNPVRERLLEQALLGGYMHAGMSEMVTEYEQRFGLDQPLWVQYFRYLSDLSRLDFNYSIASYPRTVKEIMADALPWTIGLLATSGSSRRRR
jgi:peptide/nickel transport system permease protein